MQKYSFAERRLPPFSGAETFGFHQSSTRTHGQAVVVRTRESMPMNTMDIDGATASTTNKGLRMPRRQICDPLLRNWSIEPRHQPECAALAASSAPPFTPTLRQQVETDNVQTLWREQGQLGAQLAGPDQPRRVRKDFRRTNDTSGIDGSQPRLRIGRNSEGIFRRDPCMVLEPALPVTELERRRAMRTPWPDEAPLAQAIASRSKSMQRVHDLLARQGFTPQDRARLLLGGRDACADRVCVIRPASSAAVLRQQMRESRSCAGLRS